MTYKVFVSCYLLSASLTRLINVCIEWWDINYKAYVDADKAKIIDHRLGKFVVFCMGKLIDQHDQENRMASLIGTSRFNIWETRTGPDMGLRGSYGQFEEFQRLHNVRKKYLEECAVRIDNLKGLQKKKGEIESNAEDEDKDTNKDDNSSSSLPSVNKPKGHEKQCTLCGKSMCSVCGQTMCFSCGKRVV